MCFFTASESKPVEGALLTETAVETPQPAASADAPPAAASADDAPPENLSQEVPTDAQQIEDKPAEDVPAAETMDKSAAVATGSAAENNAEAAAAEMVAEESDVKAIAERIVSASLEREHSVMGQGDLLVDWYPTHLRVHMLLFQCLSSNKD